MAKTLENEDTGIYGPNGKNVAELVARISNINFYSALGDKDSQVAVENYIQAFINDLNAESFQVVALTKDELPDFLEAMQLETSSLWENFQQIPVNIKEKLEETDRLDLLTFANDIIPEQVFHDAYDGSFKQLELVSRTAISMFTGTGMYIAGLAVAWELLGDLPGWENNPFLSLIEVFEKGHMPLGLYGNQFYVI